MPMRLYIRTCSGISIVISEKTLFDCSAVITEKPCATELTVIKQPKQIAINKINNRLILRLNKNRILKNNILLYLLLKNITQ